MEPPLPLFRSAAVAASRNGALCAIVLVRPLSFAALTGCVATLAAGVLGFAYFGSYTAHSTLKGKVVPETGVIEVTSPQPGTILEKHVVEGQRVRSGDVLYVVSSERFSAAGIATQQAVGEELVRRRRSLLAQIDSTRELERLERAALAGRLAAVRAEAASIDETLAVQRERLTIVARTMERYRAMRQSGFLSEEQWMAREAERLEQRSRVQTLERERAGVMQVLEDLDGRAATLELEYGNAIAELERAVGAAELEIAENDAKRAIVVTAPQSGTAAAVVAEVGQPIERGVTLARIVPNATVLVAELLAPSRAVGFVSAGEAVRLRYAAFPYQKFGHASGTVVAVSQTTLAASGAGLSQALGRPEPVYRVVVALHSQTIDAYGEPRRLLPGMEVEADVLLETRRLYEWVFEPLFALLERTR